MTLRLNTAVAVRIDPIYELGPEQVDPETGETFREVVGVKPGAHVEVHPQTIAIHPALAWGFVEPAQPVHDPGALMRTMGASLEAYEQAAPPSDPPSPWDLFYDDPGAGDEG